MLSIFLLQKIFGIPTIALLRIFFQFSKELREFCGIESVPDDAQFTRFKQDFVPQLEEMFHELVDLTEPICERIDKNLTSMLIYDTTGIEPYVTENNDKFLNKVIRQVKASNKGKSNDHIHNIAYSRMPKVSSLILIRVLFLQMGHNIQFDSILLTSRIISYLIDFSVKHS